MIKSLRVFAAHTPSLTVGTVFLLCSFLFGNWLARLPEVKANLALSESQLGLALLGLPIGALSITLQSSKILSGIPNGKSTAYSLVALSISIMLPAYAFNFWTLLIALIFVGLSEGILNISMNAAAAVIEDRYRISIMSTCHGMFSFGGMLGAGLGGIFAAAAIPLSIHLTIFALLTLVVLWNLKPILWQLPHENVEATTLTLPPKAVFNLVIIGFCIMLGEGAVADWGAIYLRESIGSSVFIASMGFALFSMAMAIGRFSGDNLRLNWSSGSLIRIGSFLGALGLLITIFFPNVVPTLVGFLITGLGFSIVVPLLFILSAQTPGVNPSHGIAAVATSGIVGFLLGPPLIGFIAESFGLSTGLFIVAMLSLLSMVLAFRLDR